ncbi:hypothetical protein NDU88_001951 [Pleurodeles waltl]|uniref:Uncharacterized protein n=1 Tax=Pleurodeles waltl TaxID=8319 RepID=A0AAV7S920_PLEWA|nr:hypothetical protein NDU88_001951 [Pleurodeles waltl]
MSLLTFRNPESPFRTSLMVCWNTFAMLEIPKLRRMYLQRPLTWEVAPWDAPGLIGSQVCQKSIRTPGRGGRIRTAGGLGARTRVGQLVADDEPLRMDSRAAAGSRCGQ